MPPTENTIESHVRHLKRLLAAIALQNGGEYHIERQYLRKLDEIGARVALVEDLDSTADVVVLRFASKHSAVYLVDPEPCSTTQPLNDSGKSSNQTVVSPQNPVNAPPEKARVVKPLTDEMIAKAERKLRAIKTVRQMQRQQSEPRPEVLSNPLE